jgi:hypothetical protein
MSRDWRMREGSSIAATKASAVSWPTPGIVISRRQAAEAFVTRPGRPLGFRGGNYEVSIPGVGLFFVEIHTLGGSVPVHRFWIQLDCPLICW